MYQSDWFNSEYKTHCRYCYEVTVLTLIYDMDGIPRVWKCNKCRRPHSLREVR